MRIVFILSAFLLCILLINACTPVASPPREVALNFLNALQKRDYTKARSYANAETDHLLQVMERVEKLNGEVRETDTGPITIVSEEIRGNRATVFYKESNDPLEHKIGLVKEQDGDKKVWKINMSKTDVQLDTPESIDLTGQDVNTLPS